MGIIIQDLAITPYYHLPPIKTQLLCDFLEARYLKIRHIVTSSLLDEHLRLCFSLLLAVFLSTPWSVYHDVLSAVIRGRGLGQRTWNIVALARLCGNACDSRRPVSQRAARFLLACGAWEGALDRCLPLTVLVTGRRGAPRHPQSLLSLAKTSLQGLELFVPDGDGLLPGICQPIEHESNGLEYMCRCVCTYR